MGNYFYGWYFKCQGEDGTVAVIPAIHKVGGRVTSSVQLITDNETFWVDYPGESFVQHKGDFGVAVGDCDFGPAGLSLSIRGENLVAEGKLTFGALTPPEGDIMGPFRFVPFLQCRHTVISYRHAVDGELVLNGKRFSFRNGEGYIEGDRGRSFPKKYLWTQVNEGMDSLMLSVATVPLGPFRLTGIICGIVTKDREIRIATYRGAKVVSNENGRVVIRQKDYTLTVEQLERQAHPLRAPESGAMSRTIHESASCSASYRLEQRGVTVFERQSSRASFEYEF